MQLGEAVRALGDARAQPLHERSQSPAHAAQVVAPVGVAPDLEPVDHQRESRKRPQQRRGRAARSTGTRRCGRRRSGGRCEAGAGTPRARTRAAAGCAVARRAVYSAMRGPAATTRTRASRSTRRPALPLAQGQVGDFVALLPAARRGCGTSARHRRRCRGRGSRRRRRCACRLGECQTVSFRPATPDDEHLARSLRRVPAAVFAGDPRVWRLAALFALPLALLVCFYCVRPQDYNTGTNSVEVHGYVARASGAPARVRAGPADTAGHGARALQAAVSHAGASGAAPGASDRRGYAAKAT